MPRRPPSSILHPRRLLVRGVNWLGDAVMTTPALLRLREAMPETHITLLTPEKLEDLWREHPAVDEALVYVGSRDKHLHAVDRLTGKLRWKFQTSGRVSSAPLVFDDAVVFGSSDGRLYAVTKADGKELWRLDLGEELLVAPAYVGGRIAIGGNDGTFFMVQGNAQP